MRKEIENEKDRKRRLCLFFDRTLRQRVLELRAFRLGGRPDLNIPAINKKEHDMPYVKFLKGLRKYLKAVSMALLLVFTIR